ncbi:MAG: hypothetical protein U5K35_00455 [Rhodohalobacter sp.]|nr:hypothetical protein [Rhodohalobacter sp.]
MAKFVQLTGWKRYRVPVDFETQQPMRIRLQELLFKWTNLWSKHFL